MDKLVGFCNDELQKSGWFVFNDHHVSLETVRLLEDYEKEANFPLPAELRFYDALVSHRGIQVEENLYTWNDITCILVKSDTVPADYGSFERFRTNKYLVFALKSGEIIQIKAEKPEQYSNLLGHFIELYRQGLTK